jgi:hypothetical protein
MWRHFGIHYRRDSSTTWIEHPFDSSARIHFLADVPHVVKNLCNALLTHKKFLLSADVVDQHSLPSDTVDLSHIHEVVEVQGDDLKLAPGLSSKSINSTNHFSKMKVRTALQLFSKSVSAALRTLVADEGRPDSYLTTAWFVDCVDTWFNLMSSLHPAIALSRRNDQAFTTAVSFLDSFMTTISTIRISSKPGWKPVQTGVLLSTRSVLNLCEDLLGDTLQFLMTSRLTQDCVENLFSVVRSKNAIPTSREFKYALRVICVAQYLRPVGSSNYDCDDREYLGELLPTDITPTVTDIPDSTGLEDAYLTLTIQSASDELGSLEKQSLYYLAGYCAQSLKKQRWACDSCISCLQRDPDSSRHQYATLLSFRNFKDGALFEVNDTTFNLFFSREVLFGQHQSDVKRDDICRKTLKEWLAVESALTIPDCHPLILRLAKKLLDVRLHILCKRMTERLEKPTATVPLGSRSMAMRTLVQKI